MLPVNSGEIIVNLKPRNQLTKPPEQILAEVREQIEQIPGVAVAFTQPLQNKIDESLEGTPAPLQVKLFGPDIQRAGRRRASRSRRSCSGRAGVADVKMDQAAGIPQVQIADRPAGRGALRRLGGGRSPRSCGWPSAARS